MERFGHKPYLRDCIDALSEYFQRVQRYSEIGEENPIGNAFEVQTKRQYYSFGEQDERLGGVPAVCLRVPTGGGKTALGVRAIKTVRDTFLATPHPWVLWLVPSTTIRDQTLRQMRDRSAPLRKLLEEELGSNVLPLNIRNALEISRGDAMGNTVILVSTLATSRVEKTESRRFYRENGTLMAHFENLPPVLCEPLEKSEAGAVIPSLSNLVRLHRPLVVVDEAHNNKSNLGFETLGHMAPSAIIELTATPDTKRAKANVLHYVMASQLKAAQMIKMPLLARQENDWKKCLAEAKAQREDLERIALCEEEATGEFLRPIALIGAERKNEHYTVERVVGVLENELRIPREQIAIATGDQDEIGEQSIGARTCEIRYIVTVDKLREGWDCPSAYVLASVREMKSATAVEQLVGRILRMPGAKRKENEALNKSYAFLRSQGTLDAIDALKDALVNNGFSRPETDALIEQPALPLEMPTNKITVAKLQPLLNFNAGIKRVQDWKIPLLALDFGGDPIALEPDFFLPTRWDIRIHPAILTNEDLGLRDEGKSFELDYAERGLTIRQQWFSIAGLDQQLKLLSAESNWKSVSDMTLWLDHTIAHRDIPHAAMRVWLTKLCIDLEARFSLRELEMNRMRVRRAIIQKIHAIRLLEKQKTQLELLEGGNVNGWGEALLSENVAWELPDVYAPPELYRGAYQFKRHVFDGIVGYLNGEEEKCARHLDSAPNVRHWFRNVEKQPGAFWLPTTKDKFYPDFVAESTSGKSLIIEYKGADRITNDDSEEKEAIGDLWAKLSNGKGAFVLVGAKDYQSKILAL